MEHLLNNNLKVSIITVCLNCESTVDKTIQSVISQTYPNIEYVIIDGESTDNTLKLIHNYRSNIDILISETDDGIYYAMNKGAKLATGDIIYFLNSGDYFCNENIIKNVVKILTEKEDIDIIYGNFIYYDDNSDELYVTRCKNNIEVVAKGINHQSIFARKKVFEKSGFFDASYMVYGDYDWLIRALIKNNHKIMHVDMPIVCYLKGGISDKNIRKFLFERFDISVKYLSLITLLKYLALYPKTIKRDLKIKVLKTFKLRDFR